MINTAGFINPNLTLYGKIKHVPNHQSVVYFWMKTTSDSSSWTSILGAEIDIGHEPPRGTWVCTMTPAEPVIIFWGTRHWLFTIPLTYFLHLIWSALSCLKKKNHPPATMARYWICTCRVLKIIFVVHIYIYIQSVDDWPHKLKIVMNHKLNKHRRRKDVSDCFRNIVESIYKMWMSRLYYSLLSKIYVFSAG